MASILDLARNGDPPFLKGVLPVSEARPGDLVTFGGTEHVAVVTKVDSAGVHTIAGNTSQSNVSETTYSPSSVTGVVRPDYAAGRPGSVPGAWDYSGVAAARRRRCRERAARRARRRGARGSGGGATADECSDVRATGRGAAAAEPPSTRRRHARPAGTRFSSFPRCSRVLARPSSGSPLAPARSSRASSSSRARRQCRSPYRAPRQRRSQLPAGCSTRPPARRRTTGGSISVSSRLLTSGQAKFAGRLAELTGLDPRVVAAWELAEESGGAAQAREAASNFNWLNIGYFDSGAGKIAFDKTFSDPVSAAEQSAKFLKGEWGGASSSIRAILNSVGHSPDEQMAAIANSDWASSHYGGGANLHGTFDELADIRVEKSTVA